MSLISSSLVLGFFFCFVFRFFSCFVFWLFFETKSGNNMLVGISLYPRSMRDSIAGYDYAMDKELSWPSA